MNKAIILVVFSYLINLFVPTCTYKSYPITTLINAKWNVTPFALEISEYLADENQNLFWDYVHEIANLDKPLKLFENDFKNYKVALGIAEKLISSTQISLLKLSLSLHTLSPRIQANLQIASEILKNVCADSDAFVNIGSQVVCKTKDFDSVLEQENLSPHKIEIFNFDHVYPGSENNSVAVVLYGELGSDNFSRFHKVLKKKAEIGEIKYILRHYLKVSQILFLNFTEIIINIEIQ